MASRKKGTRNTAEKPTAWPLPDRAAFVPFAANAFGYAARKSRTTTAAGTVDLFAHQRFCREYLQHAGPYRGLLLYHGLGSGKSCSAIAVAEALRASAGREVYVMLPASLRRNYVREVRRCGGRMFRETQSWRLLRTSGEVEAHGLQKTAPWLMAVSPKLVAAHGGVWAPAEGPDDGGGTGTGTDNDKGTPFEELAPSDREAVLKQVDDVVARTHHFVHYNGLNVRSLAELVKGPHNRFDDAVIVIDEVHNFMSNLAGGKLVAGLYRRLLEARRCKIVMLSGTPLVNEPEELAHLANLAAGPIVVHEVPVGTAGLPDDVEDRLRACEDVHEFWEEQRDGGARHMLCIRLVPEGFVRAPGDRSGTFVVRSADGKQEEAQLRSALGAAELGPLALGAPARRELELLPSDAAEFRRMYVDEQSDEIRNSEDLALRLLGTVSFFRDQDASLYPEIRSVKLVRLALSARQFSEYTTQRTGERRREEAARRFAAIRGRDGGGADGGSGVGMRPFSRAACTFVFPEGVPRPRRGQPATFLPEDGTTTDDGGASEEEDETSADRRYSRALDRAVEALRTLPPDQMKTAADGGRLSDLSPKFDAIIGSLKALNRAGGTAIVYSQFRRAEGVAILAVALEANGFVQLAVARPEPSAPLAATLLVGGRAVPESALTPELLARPRYVMYSNEDEDAADALRNLFNDRASEAPKSVRDSLAALQPTHGKPRGSNAGKEDQRLLTNLRGQQACAMLITRSGAEGIQTRNVREVHVIEPFWHANRVDQVIGRARRLNSHEDLPPTDRTIDVRVYLATFNTEQAKSHRSDQYRTSDEHVHEVAQRKRRLLSDLLDVMRSAAVDCAADAEGKGRGRPRRACVAAPEGAGPDHRMYDVKRKV